MSENYVMFYVNDSEIFCEFECNNTNVFASLLKNIIESEITEETVDYICESLKESGRENDSEQIRRITKRDKDPVVKPSQYNR